MFPLLSNFTIPVAALVMIWMLLEQDRRGCDIGASALVALALATSSVGLLTVMTVVAELVLRRERRWWRWAVFAPPIVLWGIWYLAYDAGHTGAGGTVGSVASFAYHQFLATFVGLAAGSQVGGAVVFCVTVTVITAAITRWRAFDRTAGIIRGDVRRLPAADAISGTPPARSSMSRRSPLTPSASSGSTASWCSACSCSASVAAGSTPSRSPACWSSSWRTPPCSQTGWSTTGARPCPTGATPARHSSRSTRSEIAPIPTVRFPLGFIPVPTHGYQSLARHFGSPVAGVPPSQLGGRADAPPCAGTAGWCTTSGSGSDPTSHPQPVPRWARRWAASRRGGPRRCASGPVRNPRRSRCADSSGGRWEPHGRDRPGGAGIRARDPTRRWSLPWFVHVDQPDTVIERCG